jgi:hypothetical protein
MGWWGDPHAADAAEELEHLEALLAARSGALHRENPSQGEHVHYGDPLDTLRGTSSITHGHVFITFSPQK